MLAQQESDRRGTRRIAFQRFADGSAQCGGAILIQQFEQLRGLAAGRFSLREGQIQKCFTLRHGLLQSASGCGVECFALDLEHRLLMRGIQHQLVAIIGAG